MRIKLEPQPKNEKGFYSFHNGYSWQRFTNFRKYQKALKQHEHFLNGCLKIKKRKLLESLVENDLANVHSLSGDLLRIELLLTRQGGYTGIVNVNSLLIP